MKISAREFLLCCPQRSGQVGFGMRSLFQCAVIYHNSLFPGGEDLVMVLPKNETSKCDFHTIFKETLIKSSAYIATLDLQANWLKNSQEY